MYAKKILGGLFIGFSIPFLTGAYDSFMFSLHPNTMGGGPKAVVSGAIGVVAVIVGLRLLFKKPKNKQLIANDEPKDIHVKCHACDKETFKSDTHEHLGVNICTDCWEMAHKY